MSLEITRVQYKFFCDVFFINLQGTSGCVSVIGICCTAVLRCIILVFMVGWVVGEVRVLFVMNSWILFCCTGFFRSFLVISYGFEPLWSGLPPRHVSITSEDEQMLLPRQRFNRLKGSVNRHCVFWQSLNSTNLSLLRFFFCFLFFVFFLFFLKFRT